MEHGRIKVKQPAEIQAERKKQERALAKKFAEDLEKAWEKRRDNCYDKETFNITGRILLQNPDYQTIWNFRREIILNWREQSLPDANADTTTTITTTPTTTTITTTPTTTTTDTPTTATTTEPVASSTNEDEMEKIYQDELKFSSTCLVNHPKSYASWYHRRFVIKSMKNPPFEREIQSCDMLLNTDERNFHCWDYRRFICSYGKIDIQNELEYTKKKISQNFSNFSSFYYRSSLLTLAHNEGLLDINDHWDSDYETISNAIFVDPNDQSPWFYHKWLLAIDQYITYQQPEPETLLHKVMLDKTNGLMVYQFHQPLHQPPFETMSLVTKDGQAISLDDISWKKMQPISSYLWFHHIDNCDSVVVSFQYSKKQYTIDLPDLDEKSQLKVNVISPLPKMNTLNPKPKLDESKMNNLKLLLEIEPDNKWINLAMSLLTGGPDDEVFDKLIHIDPLRRNYYNDQRSKQIMDRRLQDYQLGSELNISNLNLTCLYFVNHLTNLRLLDLSENKFVKLSASFNTLIVLETLIMDKNSITMVDKEFEMFSLKKLSLKGNGLEKYDCLEPIKNCPSLKILDLTGNQINPEEPSLLPANIQIIL